MHWTSEEIHCARGCQKIQNYRHILQVSRDDEWVNGGKFPPSLGSFDTIPKAKLGQFLDCTRYLYLDAVHMDIAFGNCLAIGENLFFASGQICPFGLSFPSLFQNRGKFAPNFSPLIYNSINILKKSVTPSNVVV
jgi:hypothetical protein